MSPDPASRTDRWALPDWSAVPLVALLTTATIAVPYWTQSYARVQDDGIFGSFRFVWTVLFLGTVLAGTVSEAPSWAVLPTMLACAPIAVMGRVVMDTAVDPTSHNLWPLELVLSGFMSLPPVCVAGAVAWIIRRLSPSSR